MSAAAASFDRQKQQQLEPPLLLAPAKASHFHPHPPHLQAPAQQQRIPYQLQHQQLLFLHPPERQARRLEFERALARLEPTYTSTPSRSKDYSRPLHVDCSVEYELPSQAKPPPGAQGEPLLMIHPSYYRRAERERRTTFVNNLPAVQAAAAAAPASGTSLRTGKGGRRRSSVQPPLPTAAKAPTLDEVVLKSCGYPAYFQAQKHTAATTSANPPRQQQLQIHQQRPSLHPYKRSAAAATAVRSSAKSASSSSSASSTPAVYGLYPQQRLAQQPHRQFHPLPHQQQQQQQFLHALQQQQRPTAAPTTTTATTTSLITANPAAFFEPPPLYHHHHHHHHHALLPQS